jgi:hypothetical protein
LKACTGCALEHPRFKKKVSDIFHDRVYTTFRFVCKEALLPLAYAIGEDLFLA